MSFMEKNMETVCGWSLQEIVDLANEWGAPLSEVAIEPVHLGPGLVSVPALIWYREDGK